MGTASEGTEAARAVRSDVNAFFPTRDHGPRRRLGQVRPDRFPQRRPPRQGRQPAAPRRRTARRSPASLDAAGTRSGSTAQCPTSASIPVVLLGAFGKNVTYTGAKAVQSGLPARQQAQADDGQVHEARHLHVLLRRPPGHEGHGQRRRQAKKIPTAAQDARRVEAQVAQRAEDRQGACERRRRRRTPSTSASPARSGVEYFGFLPATLNVPAGTTVKFQMSPARSRSTPPPPARATRTRSRTPTSASSRPSFEAPAIDPAACTRATRRPTRVADAGARTATASGTPACWTPRRPRRCRHRTR